MLQLRGITKEYIVGDQIIGALQGIDVDFRKNEFVAVLGPSGCGKTTLMNIVGGLDKYTSGDLIIDGKSTKDFKDSEWDNYRNKKIGFVFQSYNLIPHLSVLGNVELALTISGISNEERKRRAKEALAQVGLADRLRQKPNQLSGGQMQRVAIARALVNRPEILLADEPTGALDTETSKQIMALIKEIAKDRLVIMVTHNPELSQKYSTREIKMLDGKIIEDSKPYLAESHMLLAKKSDIVNPVKDADGQIINPTDTSNADETGKQQKNKSSMSFLTALSLSGRNLITKKGRTILTSIAGSIGIIGIALILALSNGMNNYVSKLQADMLSSTPITISSSTIDMSQAMVAMGQQEKLEEFSSVKKVFVQQSAAASDMMKKNNLTQDYVDYINENLDESWYNDIIFKTGLDVTFYGIKPEQTTYTELNSTSGGNDGMIFSNNSGPNWQLMLKLDFTQSQYDVLEGDFPSGKNEVALIISESNQLSESALIGLGLRNVGDESKEYSFDEIIGKEYKIVKNDLLYEHTGSGFQKRLIPEIDFDSAQTVVVSAIIRVKEGVTGGSLSSGIGYTQDLYDWLQAENRNSEIIQYMNDNPTLNPLKGTAYIPEQVGETAEDLREDDYRMLGGELTPNEISIYPVSYETKELIKTALDNYNIGKAKDDIITYTDMADILGSAFTSVISVITYVLIAFTAISLLVSCIMIAIITYVSVLERTKEIGILRSIGARKRDVTRVFNAETFIIGFAAGFIGVLFAYLLSVVINLIIGAALGISGIASLKILSALMLIGISIALTVISGLIPARKAAKRDPVTALRTE